MVQQPRQPGAPVPLGARRPQCDSEVLGLLMARFPGALGLRAARAAEAAEGRLAILGLWRNPARLLIVRNGNPLCFGETNGGFYFGSLPDELPGEVMSITDHYAGVLTYRRRRTATRGLFDREVSDAILYDHEAAAVLHVDPSRVRLLCKRGRIKTIKVGNTYAHLRERTGAVRRDRRAAREGRAAARSLCQQAAATVPIEHGVLSSR